jgi:hypothetical protein
MMVPDDSDLVRLVLTTARILRAHLDDTLRYAIASTVAERKTLTDDWKDLNEALAPFDEALAPFDPTPAKPVNEAAAAPVPYLRCQKERMQAKLVYPRTCEMCGLGPCKLGHAKDWPMSENRVG